MEDTYQLFRSAQTQSMKRVPHWPPTLFHQPSGLVHPVALHFTLQTKQRQVQQNIGPEANVHLFSKVYNDLARHMPAGSYCTQQYNNESGALKRKHNGEPRQPYRSGKLNLAETAEIPSD